MHLICSNYRKSSPLSVLREEKINICRLACSYYFDRMKKCYHKAREHTTTQHKHIQGQSTLGAIVIGRAQMLKCANKLMCIFYEMVEPAGVKQVAAAPSSGGANITIQEGYGGSQSESSALLSVCAVVEKKYW